MFRRGAISPETLACLERVEDWTRTRFAVPDDQLVLVAEEDGRVPGFPPRLTTVRFWTAPDDRYRFRLFKPACAVTEDDLPLAWLLPMLKDDGDPDCC